MTKPKQTRYGGTTLLSCVCDSPQQDTLHGAGVRVFNRAPGNPKNRNESRWRCSVCKETREYNKKESI